MFIIRTQILQTTEGTQRAVGIDFQFQVTLIFPGCADWLKYKRRFKSREPRDDPISSK